MTVHSFACIAPQPTQARPATFSRCTGEAANPRPRLSGLGAGEAENDLSGTERVRSQSAQTCDWVPVPSATHLWNWQRPVTVR